MWAVSAVLAMPVATAFADAPVNRYSYPEAGVVYDTRTKLTWQQKVDGMVYTQSAAVDYCANLQLGNQKWRLPTKAELVTLVDPTKYDPAIASDVFPGTPTAKYPNGNVALFWTSTPDVRNRGFFWTVDFNSGNFSSVSITATAVTGNTVSVRCVH
jgi:hypothetical protein